MHQAAERENAAAKAHLKIDTGFHRLGAVPAQLPSLLEAFSHYPNVKMEGMFTHFAAADAADDAFVDTPVSYTHLKAGLFPAFFFLRGQRGKWE